MHFQIPQLQQFDHNDKMAISLPINLLRVDSGKPAESQIATFCYFTYKVTFWSLSKPYSIVTLIFHQPFWILNIPDDHCGSLQVLFKYSEQTQMRITMTTGQYPGTRSRFPYRSPTSNRCKASIKSIRTTTELTQHFQDFVFPQLLQ